MPGKLMDAHVSSGEGTFEVTRVDPLFDTQASLGPGTKYDLFPDGRVLVTSAKENAPLSPVTLVVNWTNGVKTR